MQEKESIMGIDLRSTFSTSGVTWPCGTEAPYNGHRFEIGIFNPRDDRAVWYLHSFQPSGSAEGRYNPKPFCSERFPLPLGAWDGLRYFIVALPEPSI